MLGNKFADMQNTFEAKLSDLERRQRDLKLSQSITLESRAE
jgi:hypothetical protein